MELKDFMDLSKLQKIQDAFSDATGLAAIAVGKNGEYITEGSNFTDFCMKYTRNSVEGNRRCVKCDNECTGTYYCHAGLMDFAFDIMLNDEKVGAIIGGQVLPSEPDDEQFRQTARELGIDEDAYVAALHQVPISSEKRIRAAAELLGDIVNQLVNLEYFRHINGDRFSQLLTSRRCFHSTHPSKLPAVAKPALVLPLLQKAWVNFLPSLLRSTATSRSLLPR